MTVSQVTKRPAGELRNIVYTDTIGETPKGYYGVMTDATDKMMLVNNQDGSWGLLQIPYPTHCCSIPYRRVDCVRGSAADALTKYLDITSCCIFHCDTLEEFAAVKYEDLKDSPCP